jgi:hypothetical protein
VGRFGSLVCGLMVGCGAPVAADGPDEVLPLSLQAPPIEALPTPPKPRPAQATAPTALALPEFLARGNVCRRAVAKRLPVCMQQWSAACDRELLAAAYRPPSHLATTGVCYYHDRVGCPQCACDYYVKVNLQGHDGGTGCLGTAEDVLAVLYGECAAQRCESR